MVALEVLGAGDGVGGLSLDVGEGLVAGCLGLGEATCGVGAGGDGGGLALLIRVDLVEARPRTASGAWEIRGIVRTGASAISWLGR